MRWKQYFSRAASFVLAVVMLLSTGTTAFAMGTDVTTDYINQETSPDITSDPKQMMPSIAPTLPTQEPEFDAAMPFTLADISLFSVKMDDAEIPIEYFQLEGGNEQDKESPCTLSFAEGLTSISGGMIQNRVPATVDNSGGQAHAFSYAHVENTRVYYMGTLEIHEDGTVQNYIYYTTDTHITNKTVYAVLKENEKISLVYNHGIYHTVEYQLQDKNGRLVKADTEGWTEDGIFGANRAYAVADGRPFSAEITIPRGYKATVTVQRKDGTGEPLHTKKLGEMMAYWQPNADKAGYNTISLVDGSPDSMVLTDSFSIENVTSDMVVNVRYEKVNEIKFNAHMWTRTTYATNRIEIMNSNGQYGTASDANSNLSTQGNSFTWEFNGITSGSGQARYTWEMNQLQINGERIRVPMTTLSNTDNSVTETTTLSTGTVVTLTVQSIGGTNGGNGQRHYILKIDNCYEDLTISGGNMVSHIHREFAIHRLQGLDDPQYWPNGGITSGGWGTLRPNTLIDKRNGPYDIAAPFRFKLGVGYENMHVRFTTKERGTVLQEDASCSGNSPYIEYLIRKDEILSANKLEEGKYEVVEYDAWKASGDGYFYFRATNALDTFMKADNQNGIVLISIYADPIKAGIDYIDGASDDNTTGPLDANIDIMPQYQSGGENGYNILNNATALVSNLVPVDKAGKWTFSYWEIAVVRNGELTDESKKDEQDAVVKIHPGNDIHVSEMAMEYLKDCLYRDEQKDRAILTLRAVWEKATEEQPIPYIVRYVLVDIDGTEMQIEEHTHTVNVDAMLVTDLYQDTEKTLSESIKAVLEGDNDYHKDYTLEGNWKVDEGKTTKKILSVSPENNIATIYLVKKTAEVTVNKVWVGDETTGTRPESIQVQLYKGEKPVEEPVTLTPEIDWRYTFKGLAEIENGQPIVYTAKEVGVPNGYAVDVAAEGHQITITNTKEHITPIATGSLKVSKIVSGSAGSTETYFHFTVELDDTEVTGEYGAMHFENGVATFELKHGGSMTATGLPAGVGYKVTETEANQDGYTTGYVGAEGTIDVGHEAGASFTNNKDGSEPGSGTNPTDPKGNLTVTKTVSGIGGDLEKEFTFTVTLINSSITGQYGGLFFENGKAVFTLKHDESVEAIGLPAGIGYTVEEREDKEYSVTKSGEEGKIEGGKTSIALFNNEKINGCTRPPVPNPGPVEPDKPAKPPILNTKDHFGYIIGYPVDYFTGEKTDDQTKKPVKPQGNITRAEVATIFFRMLTDGARTEYWSSTNNYTDVPAEAWYNNAVSTLTNAGIIDGYTDGSFRPNGKITRAEFATIAVRFFDSDYNGKDLFPDIDGHWAQDYINQAGDAGVIQGYPDGTFGPQKLITRAEAVTMVNRTLDRHPDQEHFLPDMLVWPDNMDTSKWYYADMQEATNSHEYEMKTSSDGKYEIWTKMLPIRDWEAFEKEWSDAGSASNPGEVVK